MILCQMGGQPQWHIKQDVIPLLNGNCEFTTEDGTAHKIDGKWDMIIAHPPCTHLTVSGARHFEKKRLDGRQREGIEFFCKFLTIDCDKVVIENPIGIISGDYIKQYFPDLAERYGLPIKPTQIIQPWWFGEHYTKSTCLWEKGAAPLVPNIKEQPNDCISYAWRPMRDENGKRISFNSDLCKKLRSKTFIGVAKAMAEQWG